MKEKVLIFSVLLSLSLAGCSATGISQADYDQVVKERDEYKAMYEEIIAQSSADKEEVVKDTEPEDTIVADVSDDLSASDAGNLESDVGSDDLYSQLTVNEYSYENGIGSTYHFLAIHNNSDDTIKLDANVIAKDKDGNTVGASTPSARAIAPGQDALLTSLFSDVVGIDSYEYNLTSNVDPDHVSAYPDIKIDLSYTDTKVIVSGTNTGDEILRYPEVYVLFFLDGSLIEHNSTFLTNGDNELPPGTTIAKEVSCLDDTYDDVMIFIRGDKD